MNYSQTIPCRRPSSGFQRPARGSLSSNFGVNDKCTPAGAARAQPADGDKTVIVVTGTFEPAPLEEINRSVESSGPGYRSTPPLLDRGPSKRCLAGSPPTRPEWDTGDLSVRGSNLRPNADSVGRPARERRPDGTPQPGCPDSARRSGASGSPERFRVNTLWRRRHERRR